jgi:hypothetical protein
MAGTARLKISHWQDWAILVLAGWLFLSPWIFGFASATARDLDPATAAWNAWVVAIVIAAYSIAAAVKFARWEDWVNVALGAWLVIAPWVLDFDRVTAAVWNHVIVGILIIVLASWDLREARQTAA